jgi:hypothetical protein
VHLKCGPTTGTPLAPPVDRLFAEADEAAAETDSAVADLSEEEQARTDRVEFRTRRQFRATVTADVHGATRRAGVAYRGKPTGPIENGGGGQECRRAITGPIHPIDYKMREKHRRRVLGE